MATRTLWRGERKNDRIVIVLEDARYGRRKASEVARTLTTKGEHIVLASHGAMTYAYDVTKD